MPSIILDDASRSHFPSAWLPCSTRAHGFAACFFYSSVSSFAVVRSCFLFFRVVTHVHCIDTSLLDASLTVSHIVCVDPVPRSRRRPIFSVIFFPFFPRASCAQFRDARPPSLSTLDYSCRRFHAANAQLESLAHAHRLHACTIDVTFYNIIFTLEYCIHKFWYRNSNTYLQYIY